MYRVRVFYRLGALQPSLMREVECDSFELKSGLLRVNYKNGSAEEFWMGQVNKVEVLHAEH